MHPLYLKRVCRIGLVIQFSYSLPLKIVEVCGNMQKLPVNDVTLYGLNKDTVCRMPILGPISYAGDKHDILCKRTVRWLRVVGSCIFKAVYSCLQKRCWLVVCFTCCQSPTRSSSPHEPLHLAYRHESDSERCTYVYVHTRV